MSLQSLKTVCSGQDSDSDHSNPGKEGFYELFRSGSMVYLESITAKVNCHYIHRLTHVSMVIAHECMVIHLISWSIPLFSWVVQTKNVGF